MLERETPLNYVKDEIPASPSLNVSSDVLMKTVTLAEFLIPLLTENPEKSEYYRKVTPKGVRTNFFYVTVCSLQMTMGLTQNEKHDKIIYNCNMASVSCSSK